MPRSPLIAVVILNWNGKKWLEQFLPSVTASTYHNYEVIIADNASTDDSRAFLQQYYPKLRIIRLSQNFGFTKGYNEALKMVEADYYVLLNSDVEVQAGWLEPMLALLENDPSIAACQPKVLSFHDKKMFEYAGAAGGWMDKYGYPFARGRVFDTCEEDHGQYDDAQPIFWATGAALFIRARIFHDMKGFDEYFFAHQEEIDLCWRIQLAGYKIYSCPAAVVYHVGGGTLHKENPRKTFLNFRNNKIMLSKNLPFPQYLWIMPVRDFLDGIAFWKALFSGKFREAGAIIRAHLAFINWWLFHRSKSPRPAQRKTTLPGWLPRNIIWLYFVKKKTRFSEIIGKTT